MNKEKKEKCISIKKAGAYRFTDGYQFYAHKHPEYEIICINSGYCIIELDQGVLSLKQGDCAVIKPGTYHGFTVDVQKVCSITQVEFSWPVPFLPGQDSWIKITGCEELCRILESICRCNYYRKTQEIYQTLMELSFIQLQTLLTFCEQERDVKRTGRLDRIDQIIRFVEENFTQELDIEALAKQYGISSRYLRREFLKRVGMNSSNYITMLRIAKAKKLLRDLSYSITAVAENAGFNSSQYFSRVFSRFVGVSPTKFRYVYDSGRGDGKYE